MTRPSIVSRIGATYQYLGTLGLTIIVLLGLVELGVRVLAEPLATMDITAGTLVTDARQEPYFQTHPFAAFTWIAHARHGRQSVNAAGFISTRDIPFEKTDDELRVVTLGGSSTAGTGNADAETYPRHLERMLSERFPGRVVNVINAAAGGYSTIESLGLFHARIQHLRPDVVVLMHGWNDMYYFTRKNPDLASIRLDLNLQRMWDPSAPEKPTDPLPPDVRYLGWSQAYLHLRQWIRTSGHFGDASATVVEQRHEHAEVTADGTVRILVKPVNLNAVELYRRNLLLIDRLCVELRAACYAILQPSMVSAATDLATPRGQRAAQIAALYHGFDFATHVEVYDMLYEAARSVFADRIIDARAMSGREALFFDHIHPNSTGTEMLARLVADKLTADEVR